MYWLLKKQGKLYFLQSSQTKGRDVLAAFATLVCQRNCVFLCKGKGTKAAKSVAFCDSLPVFFVARSFGFAAFKKAGKFYFLQSSQTKGRDVLASKKPSLVQLPCAKTREFGEAEFSDCLPVSCFTNAVCQNCKKLRFLR